METLHDLSDRFSDALSFLPERIRSYQEGRFLQPSNYLNASRSITNMLLVVTKGSPSSFYPGFSHY